MKIYTGCSGFYNKHWKGVFYPEELPQSKWFSYYAEHFDALELNTTFYKFPTIKVMENWYKRSPEKFLFAVKAPRIITHYKKLVDCATEFENFYNICEFGLKEKLGCFLFQFPPSFKYSEDALQMILSSLKANRPNVVEFRDGSWWNEEVKQAFTAEKVTFCIVSYPNLPDELILTSDLAYIRLHGKSKLFYSCYSDDYLYKLQKEIRNRKEINRAFVFFNNTASIAGIENAQLFGSF